MMIGNLLPLLVLSIIIHRRGPQESVTTDLNRNLSANLKDILRLGAPPVSFN